MFEFECKFENELITKVAVKDKKIIFYTPSVIEFCSKNDFPLFSPSLVDGTSTIKFNNDPTVVEFRSTINNLSEQTLTYAKKTKLINAYEDHYKSKKNDFISEIPAELSAEPSFNSPLKIGNNRSAIKACLSLFLLCCCPQKSSDESADQLLQYDANAMNFEI